MSQVLGADAVSTTTVQTLTNAVAVTCVTGNNLVPPFGTCKIFARASVYFVLGSVPTSMRLQIFRNPAAENVLVADSGIMTQAQAAAVLGQAQVEGTDAVPDGRPCAYALVVTCQGAGTNGATSRQTVFAMILSG
jgi:hypothetical protein